MSTEQAIHTKGLCKSFGKNEVLRKCSLTVEKGTIYGFWESMEQAKQLCSKY